LSSLVLTYLIKLPLQIRPSKGHLQAFDEYEKTLLRQFPKGHTQMSILLVLLNLQPILPVERIFHILPSLRNRNAFFALSWFFSDHLWSSGASNDQ